MAVNICEHIVEYLNEQKRPTRTLDIAKKVIGKDATKKSINSYLYELKKNNIVDVKFSSTSSGTLRNPRWFLIDKN